MANVMNRSSGDLIHPFFENFFSEPLGGRHLGSLMRAPEADVVELENEIQVMIEMPGLKPEDIELGLENNVLSINGEKREEGERGDRATWHLSERRYGKFSRSFLLPRDVEHDRIEASFTNGVLTVSIPKSEKARRRRIEIRNQSGSQRVEAGRVEVGGGNGDSRKG